MLDEVLDLGRVHISVADYRPQVTTKAIGTTKTVKPSMSISISIRYEDDRRNEIPIRYVSGTYTVKSS